MAIALQLSRLALCRERPMRRSKIVGPERKEPMARKGTSGSSGKTPAQERHEKFVKENGEWNRKVEESVSKLEKSVHARTPQKA